MIERTHEDLIRRVSELTGAGPEKTEEIYEAMICVFAWIVQEAEVQVTFRFDRDIRLRIRKSDGETFVETRVNPARSAQAYQSRKTHLPFAIYVDEIGRGRSKSLLPAPACAEADRHADRRRFTSTE
jgi:hypothetical protein